MEIFYKPLDMSDKIFSMSVGVEVEEFLTSPSNTYVVFDGTATILFRGTMQECYIYREVFKKENDFEPTIYSQETYDRMMELGRKSYENAKSNNQEGIGQDA